MTPGRVEFANALRGPAALAVVASHYLGTFWLDHAATLATIKLSPLQRGFDIPFLSPWLFPEIPFNWGGFGVGLFFLISGFVIPFSLQRYTPSAFLVARAVRILPVYAVGFLLGIASLVVFFAANGQPFPFSPSHVAVHTIAGLRAIIPFDRIDGVVWTIEMELRFYVVCAVVAGALARGRLIAFAAPLFLFVACILMWFVAGHEPSSVIGRASWKLMTIAALNGPFLMFMFIGVAVNYHFRRHLSSPSLTVVVVALIGIFLAGIAITPSSLTRASIGSYAVALTVFLLSYRYQGAWATAKPLRFFAAISYPLYAVHAVLGYVIIYSLTKAGYSPGGSVIVACGVSLFLSWAVHHLVEVPSQTLAQQLGRAMSGNAMSRNAKAPPTSEPTAGVMEPLSLTPFPATEVLATATQVSTRDT